MVAMGGSAMLTLLFKLVTTTLASVLAAVVARRIDNGVAAVSAAAGVGLGFTIVAFAGLSVLMRY